MKLNRMHVVLSACRTGADNQSRTDELESRLLHEDFAYDAAEGCYKGEREASFVVQVRSFPEVLELMQMSQDFQQESVMLVDARGKGYILFNDAPGMVALGAFSTSFTEPLSEYVDAYTKVGDIYYYTYNFHREV